MGKNQYMSVIDCLDYARNRLSFIARMFSAAHPDSLEFDESGLAGFCDFLRGIDDILEEAERFADQEWAESNLKKETSSMAWNDEGFLSLMAYLETIKNLVQKTSWSPEAKSRHIEEATNNIDAYLDNCFKPVIEFKNYLTQAGGEIAVQIKSCQEKKEASTPVAADDVEAPGETDLLRSATG